MTSDRTIPVKKTVSRGGKSFDQTYHVLRDDLKRALKQKDKSAALAMVGTTRAHVLKYIDDDGDTGYFHSSIGGAAREMYSAASMIVSGQPYSADAFARTVGHNDATSAFGDSTAQHIARRMHEAAHNDELTGCLNGLSSLSQAAYDSDHVEVYRGIGSAQARQIRDAFADPNVREIVVGLRPLTSFSEDHTAAQNFADDPIGGRPSARQAGSGVVIRTRLPTTSIMLSHRVANGIVEPGSSRIMRSTSEVVAFTTGAMVIRREDVVSGL